MRSLVVRGPGDVGLEGREARTPGPGEVVVRPTATGVCGTDLEIVEGRIDPAYVRYPLVPGHEWTGVIAGTGGTGPAPGTPVVVEGVVPCGRCANCLAGATNVCDTYDEIGFTRDGGAAEEVVVPAAQAHPLREDVPAEDAALAEPAAVVHRALARARPPEGARALVVGDGTVGLLAVHLLGLWSPSEVTVLGLRPEQADLASQAGAARFLTDPAETAGEFDLVIEAAGTNEAALAALAAARRGGTVVLLGLPDHGTTAPVAIDGLVNGDLTVQASFSYTASAWREVVGLLNDGRLRPGFLVTHRFSLERWAEALDTLRAGSGPRGKVLLTFDGSPAT